MSPPHPCKACNSPVSPWGDMDHSFIRCCTGPRSGTETVGENSGENLNTDRCHTLYQLLAGWADGGCRICSRWYFEWESLDVSRGWVAGVWDWDWSDSTS